MQNFMLLKKLQKNSRTKSYWHKYDGKLYSFSTFTHVLMLLTALYCLPSEHVRYDSHTVPFTAIIYRQKQLLAPPSYYPSLSFRIANAAFYVHYVHRKAWRNKGRRAWRRITLNIIESMVGRLHRKKRFASFPSPAGMSLPNSPWAGITTALLNYSCPGGVWLVTSRLGTGNSWTFFLRCIVGTRRYLLGGFQFHTTIPPPPPTYPQVLISQLSTYF